jgi:hypothetical protein
MKLFDVESVFTHRLPNVGVYALFAHELVRDECADGYRLWVITDRDDRTVEVSDFISLRFVASAGEGHFGHLIKSTVDGLIDQMLDHIVSTGWRTLAEPLGLKTQTEERGE